MCKSKVRHQSIDTAESRAAFLTWLRGVKLRSYQCPLCNGWHLTSKE